MTGSLLYTIRRTIVLALILFCISCLTAGIFAGSGTAGPKNAIVTNNDGQAVKRLNGFTCT